MQLPTSIQYLAAGHLRLIRGYHKKNGVQYRPIHPDTPLLHIARVKSPRLQRRYQEFRDWVIQQPPHAISWEQWWERYPQSPSGIYITSNHLDQLQNLPATIHQLHLSPRASNQLLELGIRSIGSLIKQAKLGIALEKLGPDTHNQVIQRLALLSQHTELGSVNWTKWLKAMNFPLLPPQTKESPSQWVEDLPKILELLPKYSLILNNPQAPTRAAIGRQYQLTRERVRQIEKDCFLRIRNAILHWNYTGMEARIHPRLEALLREFLMNQGNQVHLQNQFIQTIKTAWNITKEQAEQAAPFLLKLCQFQNRSGRLYPTKLPVQEQQELEDCLQLLNQLEWIGPHPIQEIAQKLDLDERLVQRALPFTEKWEAVDELQEVWQRRTLTGSIIQQTIHLLKQTGKPLHYTEIAKKLGRPIRTNFSKCPELQPIGKTGYWGLNQWKTFPKTCGELAVEILKAHQKPLTRQQLAQILQKEGYHKHFNPNHPDIISYGVGIFGLKAWKRQHQKKPFALSHAGIGLWILKQVKAQPNITYVALRNAFIAEYQVTPSCAATLITQHPCVLAHKPLTIDFQWQPRS